MSDYLTDGMVQTVKGIVSDWLIENGYDGLGNGDAECGCGLDDLFPCAEICCGYCEPALLYRCKDCVCDCTDRGLSIGAESFYAMKGYCEPEYKDIVGAGEQK